MASPSKAPPQQKKAGGGGGWGSVFSNAVAGLESRLDTILTDENDASAKARAAEQTSKATLAPPTQSKERDASRTRVNERLAERLAKATAPKSGSTSAVPSRTGSPAIVEDGRASEDKEDRRSTEQGSVVVENVVEKADGSIADGDSLQIASSVDASRLSTESSTRPSIDVTPSPISSRPSSDLPNGTGLKTAADLEAELVRAREENVQRQDEMHIYLEKIDALQAKLTYLAQQTVAAAKEANASTAETAPDARLAEKDERIALLMQEGEKLSKTELRHLQTIKKLRAKGSEQEKAATETKKKLDKSEQAEKDLKQRLRRAEGAERQASEKMKQIAIIEKQVDEFKVERESAAESVRSLTAQLKEAKDRADKAAKASNENDKGRIASLENDLEDAQIERKLAESRAEAEIRKMTQTVEGQKQRFSVRELELKNEISALESRVEAMRSRVEEAAADGGASGGGEGSVKLLRQVETLQSQYALAKENWETIESSLNSRLVALERERDDANRREADARKKMREAGSKARKAEETVESEAERARELETELVGSREEVRRWEATSERNESLLTDARAEFDRQRTLWEAQMNQRVEEERLKWQRSNGATFNSSTQQQHLSNRTESPATNSRKASYNADMRKPSASRNLSALQTDLQRLPSWKNSPLPVSQTPATGNGRPSPPVLSRQESMHSLNANGRRSLEVETGPDDAFDMNETPNSPDRTINDLVSTSTAPAAGPSVQLVERMSAAVRRLESEKAAFKDELARLSSQRDSARDEVVALMREVETKREKEKKEDEMERELGTLKGRYDASLEMLGEKEEEVDELKADVNELKRLYKELVEEKMGPGK